MSKNRVTINIAGSSYTILSDEKEDYVKLVSEEVNNRINNAKKSSTDISTLMAAIITAMDFCDLYRKTIKEKSELENKIKGKYALNEGLRQENSILKSRIDNIERKLSTMNMKKDGKK